MNAPPAPGDWLDRQGPAECPAEYQPWLDVVAECFETPVEEVEWRVRQAEPATIISVTLTVFRDASATRKREVSVAIHDLAQKIAAATAASKAQLQWLKLACFGDIRTAKGSLRHNANVVAISGIEADYDNEIISVDVAIDRLRAAGILAIVYTSPSHSEDAPRWRVLCPASTELPPEQRTPLLNRLNGVLGGILAGESWTLSQSYYYGSVNSNPSHRVEVVYGTPIDLRDDLDAGAIGKPGNSEPINEPPINDGGYSEPIDDKRYEAWRASVLATLRREATDGQKHFALLRCAKTLGGHQAAAGFSDATAWQWLKAALPHDSVNDWSLAERTAKDGLARGRLEPLPPLEDRRLPPPVALDDPRRKAMLKAVFRMLTLGPTPDRLHTAAHLLNEKQPNPLPPKIVDGAVRWACQKLEGDNAAS